MLKENKQKLKMLKLIEILRSESDESHPLLTHTLIEQLNLLGISCDRRTLYKDITLLNEYGYEVMKTTVNRENAYYIDDRKFSYAELKILIDAVQAAAFITDKKTIELIDKISSLGGEYKSELLKTNIVCFNKRKHTNEQIYYNVELLESAIRNRKKVSFLYFDLNENKEKIYRKNKQRYIVEPMSLVYNEDNYYLMCYSRKYNNTCNYRIDRIEQIDILEDNISLKAVLLRDEVSKYTSQVFKMYGGQTQIVTIKFKERLLGSVYDKFGENIVINRIDDTTLCTTIEIQESPTFKGWLAQFGDEMKAEENGSENSMG